MAIQPIDGKSLSLDRQAMFNSIQRCQVAFYALSQHLPDDYKVIQAQFPHAGKTSAKDGSRRFIPYESSSRAFEESMKLLSAKRPILADAVKTLIQGEDWLVKANPDIAKADDESRLRLYPTRIVLKDIPKPRQGMYFTDCNDTDTDDTDWCAAPYEAVL